MLERSDADPAALISRLYLREDATWLAELLMDLEDEVGEMARLRLIEELRREVRGEGVWWTGSHRCRSSRQQRSGSLAYGPVE